MIQSTQTLSWMYPYIRRYREDEEDSEDFEEDIDEKA